jgi:hypothetical protein
MLGLCGAPITRKLAQTLRCGQACKSYGVGELVRTLAAGAGAAHHREHALLPCRARRSLSLQHALRSERLRVIDMPQAIDARTNPNSRLLLARDVANVCRYFASQGADAEPGTFASELWDLYGRAEL